MEVEQNVDGDGDYHMEDVNEVPRFGVQPTRSLAETAESYDALYETVEQLHDNHVFICRRRPSNGQAQDATPYVVKQYAKPWRPVGNAIAMDDRQRKRAAREVDIVKELRSRPDLFVEVKGIFITNYRISVVMRKYKQDLLKLILRRFNANANFERFGDGEVHTVAARMLAALAYLHDELGVAHRDVKLLNAFLDDDVGSVVLGDMDHARSLATGEAASTTGFMVGTLPFNPPEMRLGFLGTHGRQVDIYQLGVMLYLLLSPRMLYNPDVFNHYSFFTHPDALAAWNAAAAADGAAGAARAVFVRRMMADDPALRGTAAQNRADPWLAG